MSRAHAAAVIARALECGTMEDPAATARIEELEEGLAASRSKLEAAEMLAEQRVQVRTVPTLRQARRAAGRGLLGGGAAI